MSEENTAYSYQAPDRNIYDLLFGTGASGFGLFPQVEAFYRQQFEDLGKKDSSPFTYSGDRIADFSPREQYAMRLADAGIGAYAPFLARAQGLTEEALATQAGGISEARAAQLRAQQQGEDYTRTGIGATQAAERALRGDLGAAQRAAERSAGVQQPFINRAERLARESVTAQNPFIQEALGQTRASTAEFDPASISRFSDPFEDAVVQQTIRDIQKGQATSDIARRASEVAQGALGGSRSRISQQESDRAATREMMDRVGALRSQGFTSARDAAMGEFGRARAAEQSAAGLTAGLGAQAGGARATASGLQSGLGAQAGAAQSGLSSLLSGLGAQRYGAGMGTAGALTGAGQQLYGMGTGSSGALAGLAGQLSGAQTGAAGAMQGLAGAQQGFRQGDISSMMNIGAMNRARNQALMDLNYQNFVGQYNLPQQLASGFANFLTGAGPLAGGFGYSGLSPQNPYSNFSGYGGGFNPGMAGMMQDGGSTAGKEIPEDNKGLAALARKAPEVVKKMGFQVPQKKRAGGIVNNRFPMTSRKMGA
tara:strand:- start:7877 stop:9493 length:1617 start_codon:yes stop_codon:yes gene_type:complete